MARIAAHPALQRTHFIAPELRLRRQGAAESLGAEEREQMLADAVAGKLVRLELDAITYIQRDEPNRNFVRFKPGILGALAKSFVGAPVLRDHDQGDAMARAGTVLASKRIDHEGHPAFQMTFELVAPWAVELALRGMFDRYSIGWNTTGVYECSVCGKDMFEWSAEKPCVHFPGDAVEVKGQERVVEAIVTDAEGLEVSAVSVPAVPGTQVQEIRAALSAARDANPTPASPAKSLKETPMKLLSKALGLAEDASEDQLSAALAARIATHDATAKALTDARAELAAARTELDAIAAAKLGAEVESLLEMAAKRVGQKVDAQGKRIETELSKSIRKVAETLGLAAAREIVENLPEVIPTRVLAEDPNKKPGGSSVLTADEHKILQQTGVKPEDYLREKARLSGAA